MVNIKSTQRNGKVDTQLIVNGPVEQIVSEMCGALRKMYVCMGEGNRTTAKQFRWLLTAMVADHDSPIWREM